MENLDVIIAGASFAGLAVASQVKSNVLLIDRKEIGTHQTSACGTIVKTMEKINCGQAILQTFDTATLHTKNKEIDIPLVDNFCTIDYEKFCKMFFKQSDAEFLKANVKSTNGRIVYTDKGNFESEIIVDATGWQTTLASSLRKNYVNKKMASFGVETEIKYQDDKLRFFVNPEIIERGVAWLFPAGDNSRFGVGSYAGDTHIVKNLEGFLDRYNLKIDKIHGGYFCYCLKDPVVDNIFVVGCGAGQTLPLTGEGIRRSIYFGQKCGEIIQKIIDNKITLTQGISEYRELSLRNRKYYGLLLKAQNELIKLSNWKINLLARILSFRPIASYALRKYEKI